MNRQRKEGRILHLALDDKFIDQAYRSFERVYPGKNDVIICGKTPLKYVKTKILRVISSFQLAIPFGFKEINNYDYVIVHALDKQWFRQLKYCRADIKILWIGWGYDYYDILDKIYPDLVMQKTREISKVIRREEKAIKKIKGIGHYVKYDNDKISVINKIKFFAPVLPSEFFEVKSCVNGFFPEFISWNYGTVEDDLLKGFVGEEVSGENILIGNSASDTNNHVEVLDFLGHGDFFNRKCIFPLSYGDTKYAQLICEMGQSKLGDAFLALDKFVPV